jgi:hypothetical protein
LVSWLAILTIENAFPASLIKLISSFLSYRKFKVTVEGELSTPPDIQAGVLQGCVLSPSQHSVYINDTLQSPGIYLALFADDTCVYTTDKNEGYVFRKLQRGITSVESW